MTNKCTQYTSKPSAIHWSAAKQILQYLMEICTYGILFTQGEKTMGAYMHLLAGFTDVDFAGDLNDRKSTSRWIYTFNGSPISWALKKQGLITRSSMEFELVAGLFTSVEGIW